MKSISPQYGDSAGKRFEMYMNPPGQWQFGVGFATDEQPSSYFKTDVGICLGRYQLVIGIGRRLSALCE